MLITSCQEFGMTDWPDTYLTPKYAAIRRIMKIIMFFHFNFFGFFPLDAKE